MSCKSIIRIFIIACIAAFFAGTASADLIMDNDFEASVDSADLRMDGAGQDWYESRGDDPSLLTLDELDIDGNATKKAGFEGSLSNNVYLTQEFDFAQAGTFSVRWDIYVDSILDDDDRDRSALMMIGDDSNGVDGPNSTSTERFVFMALWCEGGGGDDPADTMTLIAREPGDTYGTSSVWRQIAAGLSFDAWHTVVVSCDVVGNSYDVFVNGVLVGDGIIAYAAKDSLTAISFAQWNDGAGTFYIDDVAEVLGEEDLHVAPTFVDFGTESDVQMFRIENIGQEAFDWTAWSDEGWIVSIDPDESSGPVLPGEVVDVSVTIDRSQLGSALPDTNCRMWAAASGTGVPSGVITDNLIDDPNSLKNLTETYNEEGWAVAYYNALGDDPVIQRGDVQAFYDSNYDPAVVAMADASPMIALAHVRNCTSGCCGPDIADPHPFYREKDGKTWLFGHNGHIDKEVLEGLIGAEYLAANPPNGSGIPECDPSDPDLVVDSELYFLLLLKNIEESNWSVEQGIRDTVDDLQSYTINFILSDGYTVWGFRKGHDLAYYYDAASGYTAVASEPSNGANWTVMEDNTLVILRPGQAPSLVDFEELSQTYLGNIHVETSHGEYVDILVSAQEGIAASLEITDISRTGYQVAELMLPPDTTPCYYNKSYYFTDAPADYVGLPIIQTNLYDRSQTAEGFFTFTVNVPVKVYVLYQASVASPPDWLTDNFIANGDQVLNSMGGLFTWDVWENDYSAGSITLGANAAEGFASDVNIIMYGVVVEEQ